MGNNDSLTLPGPGVSVIIPTHNRAFLLPRAVRSVLNQTYAHFELIVVDDASSDNTVDVVNSFADIRIVYVRHSGNRGVSAARNTGIKAAQNKYISFLDDDDELLPAFLEKQVAAIKNSDGRVGVVYADLITEFDGVYRRSIIKKEGDIHRDVLKLKFDLPMQSLLIKAECFQIAGLFDEDLITAEDIDMVIRLSRHFHFAHVDQPGVIRHATAGSLCSDIDALIRGFQTLLRKHSAELEKDRQALSQFYLHIGHLLFMGGREKEARQYSLKALGMNPCSLKTAGSYLMMMLGRNMYTRIEQMYMNQKYPRLRSKPT